MGEIRMNSSIDKSVHLVLNLTKFGQVHSCAAMAHGKIVAHDTLL